ncbi:MAG TPA: pectinesterase family protein [Flavisolibacter sp.]|jgi:pectinesterase|nr:pectinesterase family protein [Flavisolibacter sp.]
MKKRNLPVWLCVIVLTIGCTQPKQLTVSREGNARFSRVQDAFDAIPQHNKKPYTIFIRNGVYKEKLYLDSTKTKITLLGEDPFKTILTYDDHSGKISPAGDTLHTFNSYTFLQEGNDFTAKNLSIANSAGYSAGQAVAMHIMGDRVKFENCRFLGNQDVLFAGRRASRQYFLNCYIEGTTDFIFGPSTAWFEGCHINCKKNSHVTAASTPKEQAFGYVFNNCVLTTDSVNVNKVSLGRPWRPYASVTYINCYMGAHILPEGWNNWRNPENEKTARYAEYQSFGPGANPSGRYMWTKQLTDEEVKHYTIENVLGDWNPKNETR